MKKILALLLAVLMLASVLPMTVSAAGDSFLSASSIALNTTYYGSITATNEKDVYRFYLDKSGRMTIDLNAYIPDTDFYLYDSDGEKIWEDTYNAWNENTEKFVLDLTLDLTKGTYYFAVVRNYKTQLGDYDFKITLKPTNESFTETGYGNNNDIKTADKISLNKTYTGLIATNDDKDLYSFTIPASGLVTINLNAFIPDTDFYLYDSDGEEIWKDTYNSWNNTTEKFVLDLQIHLTKGTYYFAVARNYKTDTGNYNFKIGFKNANESFVETGYGTNNSLADANKIAFNKNYTGQIATNDEKDFYSFTLPAAVKITIKLTTAIDGAEYYLYDSNGNSIWSKTWSTGVSSTTKKFILNESIELSKGTYYFAIARDYGSVGNYTLSVNCGHKYTNYKNYKCSVCGYIYKTATLRKTGNTWYYYKNGVIDKSNTLVKYSGNYLHVNGGKWVKDTTLVKYNGVFWYVKDGVKSNDNTLVKYNGKYYHVKNGKTVKDTTLVKYNNKWYYVKNGVKANFNGLFKYNGKYYLLKNGVKTNTTTLYKYKGVFYYIKNGVKANDNTLVKYNGVWYHVKNGKIGTVNTLAYYNGNYYHVKNGKKVNDTTLVKYANKWYYVASGKVNWNYAGLVKYKGTWYYVSEGMIDYDFYGLCNYKGTLYYINDGTICKINTTAYYRGNYYRIKNGKAVEKIW